MIKVSWKEALEYSKWICEQTGARYRLPSEAEWEYAARSGGKNDIWAGTSSERELGDYASYVATSGDKTQPVGIKKPNCFGLYDMSGNVWEWVEDCWHDNYSGAPTDGSAWLEAAGGNSSHRVFRGGSWDDNPWNLRCSIRNSDFAGYRSSSLGFRLALDLA